MPWPFCRWSTKDAFALALQPLGRHDARVAPPRVVARRPRRTHTCRRRRSDARSERARGCRPRHSSSRTSAARATRAARAAGARRGCRARTARRADRGRRRRSPDGRAGRRASTTRSCRCSSSAPSTAAPRGVPTSGKSTIRDSPVRRTVRNGRVGIHDGMPFGACFWKYDGVPDAHGSPLHRERPVAEVREDRRRDRAVEVEQVALRHPHVREEHPVAARQPDLVRHGRPPPTRGRAHSRRIGTARDPSVPTRQTDARRAVRSPRPRPLEYHRRGSAQAAAPARSVNFAYRRRKLSLTASVGPLRCFARISSASPCWSDSSPL